MNKLPEKENASDPWEALRKHTQARIGLGRSGVSIPVQENLAFKMAHAFARDAVYAQLDLDLLRAAFSRLHGPVLELQSQVTDRHQYLQRPDLGRRLSADSAAVLAGLSGKYDVCITVADGLSATAIHRHATALLGFLIPKLRDAGLSITPICIVREGRVAVSDETGAVLGARVSIILIGERPGLSSPDSLGIYLTHSPAVGNTDAHRNCISNVRPEGLSYEQAASKAQFLTTESLRLGFSGVDLKDRSSAIE